MSKCLICKGQCSPSLADMICYLKASCVQIGNTSTPVMQFLFTLSDCSLRCRNRLIRFLQFVVHTEKRSLFIRFCLKSIQYFSTLNFKCKAADNFNLSFLADHERQLNVRYFAKT